MPRPSPLPTSADLAPVLRTALAAAGLHRQVTVRPRGRTLWVAVLDGELDLATVEALALPYARETSYDERGYTLVPSLYVDVRYAPSALDRRSALVREAA